MELTPAPASYEVRNRGPWTTLELSCWPDFCLGQTTALTGGAGGGFRSSELVELLMGGFVRDNYHQPEQVHGRKVVEANRFPSCYQGADGLFTTSSGRALTVLTADCLPVYVKNNSGWALLHAGWRGACAGIVPRTLDSYFESPVDVVTGAGIGVEAYVVGQEVVDAAAGSPGVESRDELLDLNVLIQDGSECHLDLERLVGLQLSRHQIEVSSYRKMPLTTDSAAEVQLFSHRENQTDQRLLNWIFKK